MTHALCKRPFGLDGLVGLFFYQDGIQEAVKRLKFRFVREMGLTFVEMATARVDPAFLTFLRRERFLVVPVPLHQSRERWRGFNQAALLGELFAQELDLRFVQALTRIKNTRSLSELNVRVSASDDRELRQRYLSLTQRRIARRKILAEKKTRVRGQEMRGAFTINSKFKVKNSKLLLVDDVWTSGATMVECAKVLKRNGACKVWGYTFARSRW